MAQIDLKFATINLQDGYGPGLGLPIVAGTAPVAGATTVTTSGFTGAVANGDTFMFEHDTALTIFTVTAHVETTGNTTSITFTPAIPVGSAPTAGDKVLVQPHSLYVRIGEGNVSYTEKRPIVYVKDRGLLWSRRLGDQDPIDVRLDFIWEYLRGATNAPPTVEDALKQRGAASNWVTTGADPCEPYSVDIIILNKPPCPTIEPEKIILSEFCYEELAHEFKTGVVNVTGKCNITQATGVRIPVA